MAEECVVGVYDSLEKAKAAVHAIARSDFPNDKVSLVASGVKDQRELQETLQYGDDTEKDAAKGAGVGGLVGVLLGATALTIPGLGLVVIAGPLAAGLTGAIVGAFLGAMSGWGVHGDHVAEYEDKVKNGKLLVVAHGDPLHVAEAQRILKETDYDEVRLHAATSADAPDVHKS